MYFLLGISLIFALLLAVNSAATAAAAILWRLVAKRAGENWSARGRADFIFALRVFPFAAALVFAAAFLLPAYILFEPPAPSETIGFKLAVASAASAAGVLIAVCRLFRTRRATRELVSNWMTHAEPIAVAGVSVPVYRIRHRFPVVAVVGVLRPRMFVAEQIFDSLNAEEFQSVIAHETGHLVARDNLKRTLLRVCRDLLVFPLGRSLDRTWALDCETVADEYAAQTGGNRMAINLAAALIKIARIVPKGAKPSMPAGAFLIEAQTAEVAARVRNLLDIAESGEVSADSIAGKNLFRLVCVAVAVSILAFAADLNVLRAVHDALEALVALL